MPENATEPNIEEQIALRSRIAQLRSEVDSAKHEIGALKTKLGRNQGRWPKCGGFDRGGL